MWLFKIYGFFKLLIAVTIVSAIAVVVSWIIGLVRQIIRKYN